ncbi:MAG: MarC family protein [Ignavibacteriaceae bacterium]|nr:MarC family protein [Ignavibacteriaceae bacterium]HRI46865.1 MarC family protein [Ignavibacteriaceae bacterium]
MTLESFFLSFIPLFVAIDIIGTVPIFLGFTSDLSEKEKRRLIIEAVAAAFVIAVLFLVGGKLILSFLGITIDDFRIAGGIILLILAINDIMFSSEVRRKPGSKIGIVPLGIPLIIGPAALATIMILIDSFGFVATLISMTSNFLIVLLVLTFSGSVIKVMGEGGTRAFAKIASLFLAAIAVMMIRTGITNVIIKF